MDGFRRMVWTTAKLDRNHWNAEEPMRSIEVFIANEYRAKNPDAQVRLINWDLPMTHYGHLELPQQLAAAHYSVVRWLVRLSSVKAIWFSILQTRSAYISNAPKTLLAPQYPMLVRLSNRGDQP